MKPFTRPSRQRGVAVITALLLTALAITVVASLFWQQQVQVRSMENQRLRLQTQWAMRGMVDFARFWLRQDNPMLTAADGVWATPIEEARLDDYVDREKVDTEKFDATVSGRALDAQARFNITNLVDATGSINPKQVLAYQRLLANMKLDSGLAQATADAVLRARPKPRTADSGADGKTPVATPATGGGSEPVAFTQVEDLLAVPGYTPQMVEQLRDVVIILPEITGVNVNTAPAEVLAAVTMMSLSEASALTLSNPRKKFVDKANFQNNINAELIEGVELDVKSRYFLTVIRVRLDRAALDAVALINRKTDPQRTTSLVWLREN
ncbi:type II secretion system minor pseudopilin GspK [Janthinobacterium lividum]|uniref:Type II secretion system protein K n=1 Tax=Janthinobacterium lividum TaxID=29581 RepID=A0ABU0XUM2_9BURK|nr:MULTISPECIES: type II secretion system minor pseudopilin GspK [Janthinobacterium]MDQ4627229.1 type II secretion system minor pseudopilin GspK [Janthinobacterium lividum]MDQ4675456.1 type II secretion system minor pseudopilin GspK [Janthinobacterium lividum]MDQ4686187.1 type II secretion system minor pseudopilin GspK [Janthinobacterium lividum]PHV19970.1 general secretion pathway protein GspK [Janthinobacterium sp. BJB446]